MNLFDQLPPLHNLPYEEVKAICESCTRCALHKGRTKVVFGYGPVPCDLMLIGEAPGEQEDLSGLPFVGKAGQLLTKILEAVEINRETDIYIGNVVKCRPPDNRAPQNDEIESCFPYLQRQIKLVQPKLILLAGAPAVKAVLKSTEPMTKIRGTWRKLTGVLARPDEEIYVMPIFHPAYLLRNQSREVGSPKWLTWQDMKEVKNALEYYRRVHELKLTATQTDRREALKS